MKAIGGFHFNYMKMIYVFICVLLLGGVSFYFLSCKSKTSTDGQHTSAPKEYHTKTNAYSDLRKMAFNVTPEQLHLSLPSDKTIVYGVIMDWGIDTSTATIVAYQTGDASMYLSSGGGVIGGGQHQNVSDVAKRLISLAQTYLDRAVKGETNSLPLQNEVKFYLLTNKGTFIGQETMDNFENNTSSWLPLFEESNNVLTELRSITADKN